MTKSTLALSELSEKKSSAPSDAGSKHGGRGCLLPVALALGLTIGVGPIVGVGSCHRGYLMGTRSADARIAALEADLHKANATMAEDSEIIDGLSEELKEAVREITDLERALGSASREVTNVHDLISGRVECYGDRGKKRGVEPGLQCSTTKLFEIPVTCSNDLARDCVPQLSSSGYLVGIQLNMGSNGQLERGNHYMLVDIPPVTVAEESGPSLE